MSTITIRVADPEADFPRIVELLNTVEPEPITLEQLYEWHHRKGDGRILRRTVAVDEQGHVLGYGIVNREGWLPAGQFYVWVITDPAWTRQGIGTQLYREAERFLQAQGATTLTSEVREARADGLRFAERQGFSIHRHHFESTLDLETFDETPFATLLPDLENTGIRFFSLADMGNTPEAQEKLYQINRDTDRDIPGASGNYLSFEEFQEGVCRASWFRPEGQLFAADGERWVGMAAVQLLEQSQGAYNLMTGVDEAYRGRKLALALKLLAIRYAKAHGARFIRTNNDSQNAPMLAINRRLGYQPQPGTYTLRQEWGAQEK